MKERIRIINTEGKARRGEIHTPHGVVQTPAFMNVAVQLRVRFLLWI